ncbi:class C beta-lactamase [Methylobacterium sp. Leaf118]|uniref:class C beta-lactamase n=1 Tax=Methylobacterium sp. Leaf118 TaxID=2876562 RepID=UPI001E536A41|nr:class C beta-lactamase [Methylobacterium sp. Leaf118]
MPVTGTVVARALLSWALILLLPAMAAMADDRADDRAGRIAAAVERAFGPIRTEYGAPGLAVAVTVGGERAVFTVGHRAGPDNRPVTPDTLFEIGSVSKVFTATLAGAAEALGRLSFADHPGRFLPELRGTPLDAATLADLGTYTAGGLPLQFPDTVTDTASMIAYFRHWGPTAPPGTQRLYSNPSLGLFGLAAARALDGAFPELIETRLFPGLGLTGSVVRVPERAMDRYAWGTTAEGRPVRVAPGPLDAEAYGIKATVADMLRFVEVNLRPDQLPDPLRRAVEATQLGRVRVGDMVQGFGWEQYPYPVPLERLLAGNGPAMILAPNPATPLAPPQAPSGPTLFNKTGSTNGFGAYVAFVPAKGIGLVMLANRNVPIPARVRAAHAVLEALAAEAP